MAPVIHTDSRPKYSWWWDSHIPKNSKWLQENLTDMDSKVQAMIKLIEEDADSFARRAEMYYKKRPELMKLVEEFYRAYRALAERYDESTGALRQAHRTMAEAFPNQVPFLLPDDSPSGSSVTDPHTPEMSHPTRASHDPDDLNNDTLRLSSSQFSAFNRDESDELISKRGLKHFNEFSNSGQGAQHHWKIKRGLNFHEDDGNGLESEPDCQTLRSKVAAESLRAGKAETEVQTLKETLAKLEAEKEAGLLQYQKSLERLANMEAEVSQAQKDARGLEGQARKVESEVQTLQKALAKLEAEKEAGDFQYRLTLEKLSTLETELSRAQEAASELNVRACKAETEVQNLKESLAVLEAEKEASILQYQRCLDRISHLEAIIVRAKGEADGLNERASKAETDAQTLNQSLARLEAEKEACIVQYKQCMETISTLESKLSHAENDASRLNERADLAESEVQSLKHAIARLNEEKEAAVIQYEHSMATISNLETEISHAQAETKRLDKELAAEVEKVSNAEKQYLRLEKENHSLHMELESVVHKTEMQRRALLVKQEELERLRNHVHEESMRAIQAEAALQALQKLHSHSQEAQRNLTMEIQKGSLMLRDMEHWSKNLQGELQQVKEENKSLNELNSSSSLSINNLHEEIYRLKEMTRKLQEEVGLRLDQRNALQQEIYCLKQEIYDLNSRHQGVIEQVESVGLKPDSLGSSVKKLQDDNSELKKVYLKERDEKLVLLQKLENMEKILEKNALLEISLSDLSAELEAIREKVKALEEACQSFQLENSILVAEKLSLASQLESSTEGIEKLSEKNVFLESSLSDTTVELESLRAQSKSLQESFQSLDNERSDLLTDRETMVAHVKKFQETLAELKKKYTELEEKCTVLEKEKESTVHQIEELRASLDLEKQEHARFSQSSEIRLSRLEDQICVLRKEDCWRMKEFEEEQERTIKSQVEIFILQKCIRDMEEKNLTLLIECEKHFKESKLSEKLISVLEQEYYEKQLEVKSLLNQLQSLRSGIRNVLKSINAHPDYSSQSKIEEDQLLLNCILLKIEDTEDTLWRTQDEKQQAVFENLVLVTLLGQMRLEMSDLTSERSILDQEFKVQLEEVLNLQSKKQELFHMNGQLSLEAESSAKREEVLKDELNNLHVKFLNLQEAHTRVLDESSILCEGNRYLMNKLSALEKEKYMLEEENDTILGEAIALGNLSVIYKSFGDEKTAEVKALMDDMDHLHNANDGFKKGFEDMKGALELLETENLHLKESVDILGSELNTAKNANEQLNHQLGFENETLVCREMELSEVAEKLSATQTENMELHRNVEELQREWQEAKFTREGLEKQVRELSEDNPHQKAEIRFLKEVHLETKSKLAKLQEEVENRRVREESLSSELLEKRHDIKLQEEATATLYGDLQCYTVCASVFKESVEELLRACQSLGVEGYSHGAEIKRMKERLNAVEAENGVLKSNFAAYLPIIASLRESLTSLKYHILLRTKIHGEDNQDAGLGSYECETLSQEQRKAYPDVVVSDEVSGLLELQTMVKAVERAMMDMERHALQESLAANVKLETAMKEIEKLKSAKGSVRDANVQTSSYIVMDLDDEKPRDTPSSLKQQKVEPEISVVRDRLVMKDIPLDQVTESSSYDISLAPHTTSRRETGASDDQILKLWETTEKSGGRDNVLDKAENLVPTPSEEGSTTHQNEAMEELKSEYPSSELKAEKELGIDKHEISKRFKDTRQGSRRKILERLTSDAQKLTNIQITIEDLKKKMETSNKSKKTTGIDYESLKEQLKEVEVSIMQVVDVNAKLSSKTKGSLVPSEGKAAEEGEETPKVRKRRISEQARKGSELIGRLQLEVQRIQFAMLKLEEEHTAKGVSSGKRSTGVRLRDYLSGGGKSSSHRKKKGPCCTCVRPPLPDESS